MRWQRIVRWVLVAALALLVAGIYAGLRRRPGNAARETVQRSDRRAVQEASAGRTLQWKNDQAELDLSFQRMLLYEDGRQKMSGINATVRGRAGRTFQVRADEGEFAKDQSDVTLRGHVKVSSADGVTVNGEEGTYSQGEGIVRMVGPVTFTRGRLSGSGVGMTYDQSREVLWILDRAEVSVAAAGRGDPGMRITAAAAGFARADGYVRFEGRPDRRPRVERAGQRLEADDMVAFLTEDGDRLQSIELRGGSRIDGARPDPGGLESMSGRDINLTYGDDGETLRRAVVAGTGRVRIAGARGASGKTLAAEWLDIGLADDGRTLASLTGRDNVVLELPAEGTSPPRTILSGSMDAQESVAGKGITSASFQERVEYRERAASGPGRVAHADSMTVATAPGFGDLESARFVGGVEFEQGTLTGRAREARYDVARGQLNLAGTDDRTGARPELVDEQATITANRLDVTLETRLVVAWTAVSTIMRPAGVGERGGRAATKGERGTGLFADDEPTHGMSDDMTYDGNARRALYSGHVRLWQGASTVEADRATADDGTGELVATGSVRTTMPVTQVNEKTKAREQVLSRGSGGGFRYDNTAHTAVYTKDDTRPAALTGAEGDLKAARIDVQFREEANEVERLEASGAVELRLPDGRLATGAVLNYFAADERYVMSGEPVRVVDVCDVETTARTLTFYRSADRIVIDGNQERRTQTKGGAKCPGSGIR